MKRCLYILTVVFLCSCSTSSASTSSEPMAAESSEPLFMASLGRDSSGTQSEERASDLITITLDTEVGVPSSELGFGRPQYSLFEEETKRYYIYPEDIFPDIDFSSLIVGDAFYVSCLSKGPFYVMDTYPCQLAFDYEEILSLEINEAEVIEITIEDGEIVPVEGVDFSNLFEEQAIAEGKEYVPLSSVTKAYATISAKKKGVARAIYTYNPRTFNHAN